MLVALLLCSLKSYASAGAGTATACCTAACMELFAWYNSLKQRALQLDEGDYILDDTNGHETVELLVLCGTH